MRRALLLGLIGLLLVPAAAGASGMTTHAFMADRGRDGVTVPGLKALLDAHRPALLSGATYPDGGYAVSSYPGGNYGETTHWEDFVNAYVAELRADPACAPLRSPTGPCAHEVAHVMGVAAHGIGDEMWDWMFEPKAADFGESPEHPLFVSGLPGMAELGATPLSLANTMEYAMDLIAIVDHLRAAEIPAYVPSTERLLGAYARVGRSDVTADGILAGHAVSHAAVAAERAAVAVDYFRVKQRMPKSAAAMLEASGGVLDVAAAASHYYEALWAKLGGTHPLPKVAAVHPEPGETGVPWEWQGKSLSPGPREGDAENRIIAVLSNAVALPFSPESIEIVDTVSGLEVPQRDGYPRPGPYHASEGTHSIMAAPAVNLVPGRWYEVVVTQSLRDRAGAKLARPFKWRFRTATGAPVRSLAPLPAPRLLGAHHH